MGNPADSGAGGVLTSTGGTIATGGVAATGGRAATGGVAGGGGDGSGQGVAGATGHAGGATNGSGGAASGAGGATGGVSGVGGVSSSTGGAGGRGDGEAPGGGTGWGSGSTTGNGGATGGEGDSMGGQSGSAGPGGSAGGPGGSAGHGGASNGGAGGAAGGATQRVLSLDFVGGVSAGSAGGVSGTVPMGPTETAGAKPASNWNGAPGASGALSALVLSDGTPATGAAVSWNAPTYASGPGTYAVGYPDMPGDLRMLNGYLDPAWSGAPSSPVTVVSFSGLPSALTSGSYDVYIYVVGSVMTASTRGYSYTIATKTSRVVQTGPISTSPASPYPYVQAPDGGSGNYVLFRNVTGAAFNVQVKPDSGGSVFRSPINGIQIVWPSGS